ncbi:MAG: macro domain-containing protein, partial [Candidatus Methanomethylicia archaeon]
HGPVSVGSVAVTSAGRLKAKYIIHAVGPIYGEKDSDRKLSSAVRSALNKAEELKLNTIALPAISTGVYGYPLEKCAEIMANVLMEFSNKPTSLAKVILCLYDDRAFNIFNKVFTNLLLPKINSSQTNT